MVLAPLTVLNKQYSIKRALEAAGPFDAVYIGQDVNTSSEVLIREYLPVHLAQRAPGKTTLDIPTSGTGADVYQAGLSYFKKESEVLAQLAHPAIPEGYRVFEANGTAYRVRHYEEDTPLAKVLKGGKTLSERAASKIIIPVLEALHEAHGQGLYHGGVSPENIALTRAGQPMLSGFQGAFIQLARQSEGLRHLVRQGYSAVEQYTPRGNQGPWTDVYACAALLCRLVTGFEMPEAAERLEGEDPVVSFMERADVFTSMEVREAILKALVVDPARRMQNADDLRWVLADAYAQRGDTTAALASTPAWADEDAEDIEDVEAIEPAARADRPAEPGEHGEGRAEAADSKRSGLMALAIGVPVFIAVVGGGTFMLMNGSSSDGDGAYSDIRQQADSLFENADYRAAENLYTEALRERPDDPYLVQRLGQIERMQAESGETRYTQQMERGRTLMRQADALLEAGDIDEAQRQYSRASAAVFAALDGKPGDAEAGRLLDDIDDRFTEIARQRAAAAGTSATDQLYSFFREQGDQNYMEENYAAALRKYEEALNFRPNDEHVNAQIERVKEQIAASEQESAFEEYVAQGRTFGANKQYAEAKAALEAAARMQPDNEEVQRLLQRTESLLEAQQRAEKRRAGADRAFAQGKYQEAIKLYERALEADPTDTYLRSRIEESRRRMKEMRIAADKERQRPSTDAAASEGSKVHVAVDQAPTVIGGLKALHEDVHYPEFAIRKGIEGRVFVQVVVNADGTVRDAEVTKGIGAGCDKEALRVVKNVKFNPAMLDGQPVAAKTTVWIQFQLQNRGKK